MSVASDEKAPSGLRIPALPRFAPLRAILLAATLSALALFLAVSLSSRVPWLGLDLAPAAVGATVRAPAGPAADALSPGERIVALAAEGRQVPLDRLSLMDEPDMHPGYDGFDAFMLRQGQLWHVLDSPRVRLVRDDGSSVALTPAPHRPAADLPMRFWVINLSGVVALLIGVGIWAFRRDYPGTLPLLMAGVGYFAMAITQSVYISREIALPPDLFRTLSQISHLGHFAFAAAVISLLWLYPRPLGGRLVPWLAWLSAALLWLNELGYRQEWPFHTFYAPLLAAFLIVLGLAVYQWWLARDRPVDRAAIRWFLLTVLLSTGIIAVMHLLPIAVTGRPVLSITSSFLAVLAMYIGLALGIVRYRLFNLERWWFKSWLWFFSGLAIIIADLFAVLALDLVPLFSLVGSVIIIGWLYFPARQWLWQRLSTPPGSRVDDYLPAMIETLVSARSAPDFRDRWRTLLEQVFEPLHVDVVQEPHDQPTLEDHGLALSVPTYEGEAGYRLSYAKGGRRLFSSEDQRLSTAMLAVTRRAGSVRDALESGLRRERERIMRDLHDDVGAQLLTLVHRADSERNADLARSALRALRETIYSLDDRAQRELVDSIADWRAEAAERLENDGVALEWTAPDIEPGEVQLTARQRINMNRILQEALSNALKHADARTVRVVFDADGQELSLQVMNDGLTHMPEVSLPGKGLHNIRTRAQELGGEAHWYTERDRATLWYVLDVRVPLAGLEQR